MAKTNIKCPKCGDYAMHIISGETYLYKSLHRCRSCGYIDDKEILSRNSCKRSRIRFKELFREHYPNSRIRHGK